ncbi:phasin family protein [Maribius pontilimi]|uniref:Phasin family protein n=1 Tax=Palleronia pontilimi TaxID=1964209 RepID=A0A934IHY1_9RHOB|nr:phasin family protein [Palleronia pontilimi]MBJ3763690.1 phasin family protein [Palleronia pontilimi]
MPRKTADTDTTQQTFDPLAAFNPLSATGWMNTKWFENVADLGSELTNFVAERIKEDVKTQHEMLHCKTMHDLRHVQSEFLQRAIDDYQVETGKLIDMTGKMAAQMGRKDKDRSDA